MTNKIKWTDLSIYLEELDSVTSSFSWQTSQFIFEYNGMESSRRNFPIDPNAALENFMISSKRTSKLLAYLFSPLFYLYTQTILCLLHHHPPSQTFFFKALFWVWISSSIGLYYQAHHLSNWHCVKKKSYNFLLLVWWWLINFSVASITKKKDFFNDLH